MLYAYPVWCVVYPLRREGVRLEREQMLAAGRSGWLTLRKMPAGQPVLQARLTNESGRNVFAGVNNAHVKCIDRGGILITGFLDTAGGAPQRQSWWCVPFDGTQPPAPPSQTADGRRQPQPSSA